MSQIKSATTGSIDSIGGYNVKSNYVENAYYFIDYTKLSSVNDLMLVLGAVGFNFHTSHPHFEAVKHFLDLTNPIVPNKEESK
jgi:hypothetical protein